MGSDKPGGKTIGVWNLVGLTWAVLVNSVGMIADGYDLIVVDLVVAILESMHPAEMTAERKGMMVCLAYAGVITGILSFGWVVDHVGHKIGSLITAALSVLGCVVAACCRHVEGGIPIAVQLGCCRFFLGLGIGGEYPVSMVLGSGRKTGNFYRDAGFDLTVGQSLALNTAMLQVGSLCAPLLARALLGTSLELDSIWRILVLVGMLPSASALVARVWLSGHQVVEQPEDEPGSTAQGQNKSILLGLLKPSKVLIGCSFAWGFQNFVFFGQASFRSLLDDRIFHPPGGTHSRLEHNAVFGLSLTAVSLLTGIALVLTVNHFSAYWGMLVGLVSTALLSGLCSFLEGPVDAPGWALLAIMVTWTIPLSGAGMLVYIVSPQYFPMHSLATNCGITAAAGKAGALLGTALFPLIEREFGVVGLMLVCSGVALAGAVSAAALIPQTLPVKLD